MTNFWLYLRILSAVRLRIASLRENIWTQICSTFFTTYKLSITNRPVKWCPRQHRLGHRTWRFVSSLWSTLRQWFCLWRATDKSPSVASVEPSRSCWTNNKSRTRPSTFYKTSKCAKALKSSQTGPLIHRSVYWYVQNKNKTTHSQLLVIRDNHWLGNTRKSKILVKITKKIFFLITGCCLFGSQNFAKIDQSIWFISRTHSQKIVFL